MRLSLRHMPGVRPSRVQRASKLGARADGRLTLVQFSTPSCAACHTAQAPAVAQVAQRIGTQQLRVLHVDAADQPDIANAFGILTVPSTVVLDPGGRVAAVNHGFASTQQLEELHQYRPGAYGALPPVYSAKGKTAPAAP